MSKTRLFLHLTWLWAAFFSSALWAAEIVRGASTKGPVTLLAILAVLTLGDEIVKRVVWNWQRIKDGVSTLSRWWS